MLNTKEKKTGLSNEPKMGDLGKYDSIYWHDCFFKKINRLYFLRVVLGLQKN